MQHGGSSWSRESNPWPCISRWTQPLCRQGSLLCRFWMMAILTGVRGYFIVVLMCVSLKISDVEHLFIYLLAIWISSLKKYLIRPSTHFLIELFFKTSNSAKKQQKQEESIDVQVAIVFAFHLIKVAIGHSFKLKHTWERKTLPMFSFSLSALFVPSVSPEWAVLERKLLPPLPTPSQLLIFLDFVTKFYSQVWQFTICHNGTDELASFLAQVNLNEISQQVRPFTLCKAFFSSSLSH